MSGFRNLICQNIWSSLSLYSILKRKFSLRIVFVKVVAHFNENLNCCMILEAEKFLDEGNPFIYLRGKAD